MKLTQPNLSVRYNKDMGDEFRKAAIEVIKHGFGMPAFNNDEVVVPGTSSISANFPSGSVVPATTNGHPARRSRARYSSTAGMRDEGLGTHRFLEIRLIARGPGMLRSVPRLWRGDRPGHTRGLQAPLQGGGSRGPLGSPPLGVTGPGFGTADLTPDPAAAHR